MRAGEERPLADVPPWVWALLIAALAMHLWLGAMRPAPRFAADALPPAPRAEALRLISFGEPEATARLAMLFVQSVDFSGGQALAYQSLDYSRLVAWLAAILALDPRSDYPLFVAARVYAEVDDPARVRRVLDFVHRAFLEEPNRRWPWLAHGALLAKHRLKDLPLARRYAAEVQRHATDRAVPGWARQMEVFILEDMNELEAARVMIGGLLAEGYITDPEEARFLAGRLQELEARLQRQRR